jgi:hypothetical protein
MMLWKKISELVISKKLTMGKNATIDVQNSNGTTSSVDLTELASLDFGTAGTVTASKMVVVDSNKDIGDFRNLDAVNFDAGASGTAGSVDVFPSTASKGKIAITAADSAGNTTTTITNASQSGARTYTIPDAGASASFVMTEGTQTVNGTKTIAALVTTNLDAGASGTAGTVDVFPSTASKGKLTFQAADSAGDTTTTITNASQAGARTYTIPDAGASASFVMTEGNQTIAGTKTFSAGITLSAATQIDASAGATDYKVPDNNATALRFREATNDYLIINTTDNSEAVDCYKRLTTTDGVASGTARVIGGRATANVSASDTVTAVASNDSFVAFATTYDIPANTLKLGTVLRAKALVVVNDASGTDTLTVELRIGGTTLIATTAVDPGATTDLHILEFEFVSRAAPGATSSCVGYGRWTTNTGGSLVHGTGLLAPTNFATNGALTLDVRAKWSSNTASTSARLELLNVDII